MNKKTLPPPKKNKTVKQVWKEKLKKKSILK